MVSFCKPFINFFTLIIVTVQIPFEPPKTSVNGFFGSIEELLKKIWTYLADFITGKNCRYLLVISEAVKTNSRNMTILVRFL